VVVVVDVVFGGKWLVVGSSSSRMGFGVCVVGGIWFYGFWCVWWDLVL